MWFRSAKFVILLSNFFVWLFPLHTPAYKKPSPLLLHLNKLRVIVTNIVTFNHTCGQMTSSTLLLCSIALLYSASFGAEAWTSPYIPVSSLISKSLYDKFFLHKDDTACPAKDFYPYDAFIRASKSFPAFGTTGCLATRKREIAAFLAQISHETTGGWATAPDGPFAWGLCFKEEISPQSNYCDSTNTQWPCFPGKSYKGRGPIQLSWYVWSLLLCFILNSYLLL